MSGVLTGRTVLVTGASTGIGRALARALVERGARVIAVARSADKLAALAAVAGPALIPLAADVTSDESVHALVTTPSPSGRVDVVVNNAGIGYLEPFSSSDAQHWRETIETNLIGALRVTRAFLPAMLARGRGLIVNVGSNGATGWPYLSLYAASKAALDAATTAIGHECNGTGVAVIGVSIGPTQGTEFGARFTDPEALAGATAAWTRLGIPWDQFVTPEVSAERILEAIEAHAECYR